MISLVLCGATGRMGKQVATLVSKGSDFRVIAEVTRRHPLQNFIHLAEVIIDFTEPEAAVEHAKLASKYKKPIAIGTTGFTPAQMEAIKTAAGQTAIVQSPNFSIGANLLYKLIEISARTLGSYQVEITETHHIHKKDKPSGTAKKMAEIVAEAKGEMPPIHSIREGETFGEHIIIFGNTGEYLALLHQAVSLEIFAQGALKAAKWVLTRLPGFYSMADVLK